MTQLPTRVLNFAVTVLASVMISLASATVLLAQSIDATRAKTLTVEQATQLLKASNSLRLSATDLSPEVAAVLATYKGELRFEALITLSPETSAALATRTSTIDLPKVSTLTPAVAKALATTKGQLQLMGVKELSNEVAKELATHTGSLTLGVTEFSAEGGSKASCAPHPISDDSPPPLPDAASSSAASACDYRLNTDSLTSSSRSCFIRDVLFAC